MAFMRRDVNLGLLILIIAAVILFSGFSVYYQTSFHNVSMEYENKLEQLTRVSNELASQRERLNQTYSLRVRAEEDRKALDQKFMDLNDLKNTLETDKASLQSELTKTKTQLAEKSAELEVKKSEVDQVKTSLAAANSQIDLLNKRVNSLNNQLDDVCEFYEDYASQLELDEHEDC